MLAIMDHMPEDNAARVARLEQATIANTACISQTSATAAMALTESAAVERMLELEVRGLRQAIRDLEVRFEV